VPQAGEYIWDQGATVAVACFGEGTSTVYATTEVENINTTPFIGSTTSEWTTTTSIPDSKAGPPSSNNSAPMDKGLSKGTSIATIISPIVAFIGIVVTAVIAYNQRDRIRKAAHTTASHISELLP
jgi:hypothetical protein